MNYLTASTLALFGMVGGHGVARFFLAASIDGSTNVPLGAVLGSAGTVLLVGMWVSRKTTLFESKLEQQAAQITMIMEAQRGRTEHLDRIDDRLYRLENRK